MCKFCAVVVPDEKTNLEQSIDFDKEFDILYIDDDDDKEVNKMLGVFEQQIETKAPNVDIVISAMFRAFKISHRPDIFEKSDQLTLSQIIANIDHEQLMHYLDSFNKVLSLIYKYRCIYGEQYEDDGVTKISRCDLVKFFVTICMSDCETWNIAKTFVLIKLIHKACVEDEIIDKDSLFDICCKNIQFDTKTFDVSPESPIVAISLKFPDVAQNVLRFVIEREKIVGDNLTKFLTGFNVAVSKAKTIICEIPDFKDSLESVTVDTDLFINKTFFSETILEPTTPEVCSLKSGTLKTSAQEISALDKVTELSQSE